MEIIINEKITFFLQIDTRLSVLMIIGQEKPLTGAKVNYYLSILNYSEQRPYDVVLCYENG